MTAFEKAEELCSEINEAVRSQESSNRLEWLQERVNLAELEEVGWMAFYFIVWLYIRVFHRGIKRDKSLPSFLGLGRLGFGDQYL